MEMAIDETVLRPLLGYTPPPEDFVDLDALGQVTGATLHLLPARPEVQVFYTDGVARNRGNRYVRVTVECPVRYGGRFYNWAKTMDPPVNVKTGLPLVWHPGTLHPCECYLDRCRRVEAAIQQRADAFQVACLLANAVGGQVKIFPDLLVQLGEAAAGLRDQCWSDPLGRELYRRFGLGRWSDLARITPEWLTGQMAK